jgi:transcriptional regulator with XRE-family HTH domain
MPPLAEVMPRKLNVIGTKLRQLRMESGLTLEQLAAKCGISGWDVSGNTLAKIEVHLRSAFDCELIILAKALRVSVNDFIPSKLNKASLLECLNKPVRTAKLRKITKA